MKKLLLLCLLFPVVAYGEEITVSLGMSYDKAVEAIQKCGGRDISGQSDSSPHGGVEWWLDGYEAQVSLHHHYGKVNSLSYHLGRKPKPRDGRPLPDLTRSVRTLTLNTENKTVAFELDPARGKAALAGDRWQVRVEMLVVAMPQTQAFSLLPALRNENQIEEAYLKIIEAIQRKEATLIGYPVLFTLSGQKATTETILEKLYPTQFQPPQLPQQFGNQGTTTTTTTTTTEEPNTFAAIPTAFEKRNAGVTLEIEPVVETGGDWINVTMQPQHVDFQGFDAYETMKVPGTTVKVEQPRFFTTKVSTSFNVRNGQRVLCGFHKMNHADDMMELWLLQTSATQIGE